jgi:hypothetical protein
MELKRLATATAVASLLLGATVVSAPAAGASNVSAPTAATLPPSHAEASPACGPPGQSVAMTISGNIFEPNRDFRIVFTGESSVLGSGRTRGDGTFEASIQPTLTRGPRGISVEVPVFEKWQAVAIAAVTAPCPTIAVTPNPFDRGSVPTTLTINLLGFPVRRTLTLSVDGHPFATVPSEGSDGHATFTQPVRLAPPCGSYVISADVADDPPRFPHSASTVLKVPCPKLGVDPANIAKEKLPGTVHVSGSAWAPNTDVLVGLDDGTTGTVTMRSDSKGRLNGRLPVPKRDCGPVQVVGVEQTTDKPSVSITVTGAPQVASQQASATFTITCSRPPTFAVSPQVVSTAGVVRAVGTQLPPDREVLLVWTDADDNPMPGVTRTRVQSDGSLGIFVLVLPRSETGARRLQVFDSTAPGSPALVGAALLVVPGPQEPGKQQLLGRR